TQPVRALMDSWIFQAGYPMIKVEKDGPSLRLTQQIFRYLAGGSDEDRKWHTPIFLRACTKSGVVTRTTLLTDKEQRVELANEVDWAVVKARARGVFPTRHTRR